MKAELSWVCGWMGEIRNMSRRLMGGRFSLYGKLEAREWDERIFKIMGLQRPPYRL